MLLTNKKFTKTNNIPTLLMERGYYPCKQKFNLKTRDVEFIPIKNLNISTMQNSRIVFFRPFGGIEVHYGLEEAGLPPTLLWPKPKALVFGNLNRTKGYSYARRITIDRSLDDNAVAVLQRIGAVEQDHKYNVYCVECNKWILQSDIFDCKCGFCGYEDIHLFVDLLLNTTYIAKYKDRINGRT